MKIFSLVLALAAKLPRWCEWGLAVLVIGVLVDTLWLLVSPAATALSLNMPTHYAGQRTTEKALLNWFGQPAGSDAASLPSDLSLVAVIAGQQGVALIRGLEASAVAVRVGEEFRAGSRLLEVRADRIVIERAHQRQEILLPQQAMRGVNLDVGVVASKPAPPQVSVDPVTFSRGHATRLVQTSNLADWNKGLASDPEGGIRIEATAEQPLSQLLKLEQGDVIKKINAYPIRQLEDISLLYNEISKQTDLELVILRNGALQTQTFQITP